MRDPTDSPADIAAAKCRTIEPLNTTGFIPYIEAMNCMAGDIARRNSLAIFEITDAAFRPLAGTTFEQERLRERSDLQRLLRDNIEVLAADILIISEEFGRWTESNRRIDLLGVDRDANLVVIELKRTDDGGHMELQALRYAAMVSTLTFDEAVETFEKYLRQRGREGEAQQVLLDHLGWDNTEEPSFSQRVRIVLASMDFDKEITSTVLWLTGAGFMHE